MTSDQRHHAIGIVPVAKAQSMTGPEFLRGWIDGDLPSPSIGAAQWGLARLIVSPGTDSPCELSLPGEGQRTPAVGRPGAR